jgi:hypothetical protein
LINSSLFGVSDFFAFWRQLSVRNWKPSSSQDSVEMVSLLQTENAANSAHKAHKMYFRRMFRSSNWPFLLRASGIYSRVTWGDKRLKLSPNRKMEKTMVKSIVSLWRRGDTIGYYPADFPTRVAQIISRLALSSAA